ncbi:MAG TPA: hypothetical protein VNN22_19445 [Verrucomicrobiae bacterium]|nr:hypothetical protein [Verrucomicrobiae bacterium]
MNQYADKIFNALGVIGTVETVFLVIITVTAIVLWCRGISPVLYRLGNGLANRKIAIFAKGDNRASLKSLLMDSELFREKNICEISGVHDLGKAETASVYLVYWQDWANDIDKILDKKPDKCALVVYAPYNMDRIPPEQMRNLDGKRHTSVTNFRGRLLNDVVTSMITTPYTKS